MDLLAILSVLIAVLGILLTILSFKYKKLSYYIKSFTFDLKSLKDKSSKIQIFYDNQSIDRLTVSRIIILNKGNKGISNDNIVPKKPIQIELSSQCQIYEDMILYNEQEERSELYIDKENSTQNILPIKFEYLEPYQGAVIEILHNGFESDIKVTGGIRDGKNIKRINKKNIYKLINLYIIICWSIIAVFLNALYDIILKFFSFNPNVNTIICIFLGGILAAIVIEGIFKIKEIPFLASLFPNIVPSRYLQILNRNWTVK